MWSRCWVLGFRYWVLGVGFWMLGEKVNGEKVNSEKVNGEKTVHYLKQRGFYGCYKSN